MKSLITAVMASLLITSLSVQADEKLTVKQMIDHMMQQNVEQLNKQMQQENNRAISQNRLSVSKSVKPGVLLVQAAYFTGSNNKTKVNAK